MTALNIADITIAHLLFSFYAYFKYPKFFITLLQKANCLFIFSNDICMARNLKLIDKKKMTFLMIIKET
jgi:hypothetical protein